MEFPTIPLLQLANIYVAQIYQHSAITIKVELLLSLVIEFQSLVP